MSPHVCELLEPRINQLVDRMAKLERAVGVRDELVTLLLRAIQLKVDEPK